MHCLQCLFSDVFIKRLGPNQMEGKDWGRKKMLTWDRVHIQRGPRTSSGNSPLSLWMLHDILHGRVHHCGICSSCHLGTLHRCWCKAGPMLDQPCINICGGAGELKQTGGPISRDFLTGVTGVIWPLAWAGSSPEQHLVLWERRE